MSFGGQSSIDKSKSASSSTNKVKYSNTTTSNPYITSTTTNKGTKTQFAKGSGADTFNQFYNQYIGNVLNDLVNPNVNSARNQALINSYANNLNKLTTNNTEGIINNLGNRGLIRSSVANDMYKNLSKANADNLADFSASVTADNQNNATNLFNTLMNAYLQGWNIVSGNQAQSLDTSQGNATRTGYNTGKSTSQHHETSAYWGIPKNG